MNKKSFYDLIDNKAYRDYINRERSDASYRTDSGSHLIGKLEFEQKIDRVLREFITTHPNREDIDFSADSLISILNNSELDPTGYCKVYASIIELLKLVWRPEFLWTQYSNKGLRYAPERVAEYVKNLTLKINKLEISFETNNETKRTKYFINVKGIKPIQFTKAKSEEVTQHPESYISLSFPVDTKEPKAFGYGGKSRITAKKKSVDSLDVDVFNKNDVIKLDESHNGYYPIFATRDLATYTDYRNKFYSIVDPTETWLYTNVMNSTYEISTRTLHVFEASKEEPHIKGLIDIISGEDLGYINTNITLGTLRNKISDDLKDTNLEEGVAYRLFNSITDAKFLDTKGWSFSYIRDGKLINEINGKITDVNITHKEDTIYVVNGLVNIYGYINSDYPCHQYSTKPKPKAIEPSYDDNKYYILHNCLGELRGSIRNHKDYVIKGGKLLFKKSNIIAIEKVTLSRTEYPNIFKVIHSKYFDLLGFINLNHIHTPSSIIESTEI